jgi:hypothetical protein
MAVRLRSTRKINWGGWNPFIDNYLEIELTQKSKSSQNVVFEIKDIVKEERIIQIDNDELGNEQFKTIEVDSFVLRQKTFTVPTALYNQLYQASESVISTELSPFEKEIMREKMSFLMFFTNDFLTDENGVVRTDENGNSLCLYATLSNEWVIVN